MVETRAEGSTEVLRSVAERDKLKIAEECISLERVASDMAVGTTVTATLDNEHPISIDQAKRYLQPYVGMLKVPVYLNEELISGNALDSQLPLAGRQFSQLGVRSLKDDLCAGTFDVQADSNGQILIYVTNVTLGGNAIAGSMALLQNGGQLMGLRSYFGLAPIPAIGTYQLGGVANLSFLQPTAGREALSRESIDQTTRLVSIAEWAASQLLAESDLADKNNAFLQWITLHDQFSLAKTIGIRVLPEDEDVPMAAVMSHVGSRTAHYYAGTDHHIMKTFANEGTCLLHVVQGNPRRAVQLHYLTHILRIAEVPDSVQITRKYNPRDLTAREASVLLKIASILREDYLIPDIEPVLADISHNVAVYPTKVADQLTIFLARSGPLLPPLLEFYDRAEMNGA